MYDPPWFHWALCSGLFSVAAGPPTHWFHRVLCPGFFSIAAGPPTHGFDWALCPGYVSIAAMRAQDSFPSRPGLPHTCTKLECEKRSPYPVEIISTQTYCVATVVVTHVAPPLQG